MRDREEAPPIDEAWFEHELGEAIAEIVRRQAEAGIDVVDDGECSKPSFQHYAVAHGTSGWRGRRSLRAGVVADPEPAAQ
jgi:5-methyltetrahydropteroyltriglutamate--homocysteine methyltransferase